MEIASLSPCVEESSSSLKRGLEGISGWVTPLYERIAATAPTSRLVEIAVLLEKAVTNVVELTALALLLYEYQYNRPDPESVRSKIPDDETASRLIATFIARLKAVLRSHKGAKAAVCSQTYRLASTAVRRLLETCTATSSEEPV